MDGAHWYRVEIAESSLWIHSNADRDRFEDLFRLDWDAAEIERQILSLAPEMEPYMTSLNGLRLMKPSDPVETFFSFLCTPNNNVARITGMVRGLAAYGPALDEVDGQTLHRFPNVERIATIPEQELRAKAFGYRAATITSIARHILQLGGDPWIAELKDLDYEAARDKMLAIKGIGPKLADCIALFALHKTETVPVDTHVWQAMTRIYFPEWKDKPLTDVRYKAVADHLRAKFGPLTGWAHQYLFYDNLLNWRTRRQ